MPTSRLARALLIAGAVLLVATAAFHSTGLSMVAGWLPGDRGQVLGLLWLTPVADWSIVGLLWIMAAVRGRADWRAVVLISAIIPAFAAIGLFWVVGAAHPGPFMLAAATLLALIGAWRLR